LAIQTLDLFGFDDGRAILSANVDDATLQMISLNAFNLSACVVVVRVWRRNNPVQFREFTLTPPFPLMSLALTGPRFDVDIDPATGQLDVSFGNFVAQATWSCR